MREVLNRTEGSVDPSLPLQEILAAPVILNAIMKPAIRTPPC